jgi:hypothetical protein
MLLRIARVWDTELGDLLMKECPICSKKFWPNRPWQVYCCDDHRMQAYWHRKYVEDQAKREEQTDQRERGAA